MDGWKEMTFLNYVRICLSISVMPFPHLFTLQKHEMQRYFSVFNVALFTICLQHYILAKDQPEEKGWLSKNGKIRKHCSRYPALTSTQWHILFPNTICVILKPCWPHLCTWLLSICLCSWMCHYYHWTYALIVVCIVEYFELAPTDQVCCVFP